MRAITPKLTTTLRRHCRGRTVFNAPAFKINTFRGLVEEVAKVAYANRDELLFFRGQDNDYQSKAGGTTLYPSIYRGDSVSSKELQYRFDILEEAGKKLAERWKAERLKGANEVRRKRYIQWSIIQHYEITETPLIDITHSLRVACSFAQQNSTNSPCYVYVLGLPYVTNRITVNSEHDLVNIRLLSICPPDALRPYFQEGYLAGTTDITSEFDRKTDLDFRNRLVAKFAIPKSKKFWGRGFDEIPENSLFPKNDRIHDLCKGLKETLGQDLHPGDLGNFIKEWIELESKLLSLGRKVTSRNISIGNALRDLVYHGKIDKKLAMEIDDIWRVRNMIVHGINVDKYTLDQAAGNLHKILKDFMR